MLPSRPTMPRFASGKPAPPTVRESFFEWVYQQQRAQGTNTPVRPPRKKRLKKLTGSLRDTLVAAVGEDDALVTMYDTHAAFEHVHATAISFIDVSSTGHRTQLDNAYSAVMTGTVVDGPAQTPNSMTTANFEAMKVAIADTLSKRLKSEHPPFPHHVRYIELLDAIMGPGELGARREPS